MRRDRFCYAAMYCEENVWHLANDGEIPGTDPYVVFISNADRACALWRQRAAEPGEPVLWDYHVVLSTRIDGQALIWDLDSTGPFPEPVAHYLAQTFSTEVRKRYLPVFRVIPARSFLESFSSDRRHMWIDQGWTAPPPPWPCIQNGTESYNLDRFIDTNRDGEGALATLDRLAALL